MSKKRREKWCRKLFAWAIVEAFEELLFYRKVTREEILQEYKFLGNQRYHDLLPKPIPPYISKEEIEELKKAIRKRIKGKQTRMIMGKPRILMITHKVQPSPDSKGVKSWRLKV